MSAMKNLKTEMEELDVFDFRSGLVRRNADGTPMTMQFPDGDCRHVFYETDECEEGE